MSTERRVREATFRHVVVDGSSYEVGRALGEVVRRIPGYSDFMTSPFMGLAKLASREVAAARAFFATHCPGVNEEIDGFAGSLGVDADRVVYNYSYVQPPAGGCSQLAVLPAATRDGRAYLARNYDFTWDDTPLLCTTRVEGRAAHIGFAVQVFGRSEGMNEYGLCISTSAGVVGAITREEGCKFCNVVRTVLEECRTVDEALATIAATPISDRRNFMLADRCGSVALIEVASAERRTLRVEPDGETGHLCSTNHYTHSDMAAYDLARTWNSVARYQAIDSRLRATAPQIDGETIRGILAAPVPAGACCHHYSAGMGTMWSALFDPTEGRAEFCFGSPNLNDWRTFRLDGPPGVAAYVARLPDEPAAADFFATVSPGEL